MVHPTATYFPCSAQRVAGALTEVFHVFVNDSERDAKVESIKAAATVQRRSERAAARLRAISAIAVKKAEVKRLAAQPVLLSNVQYGMLCLRRGFLIAQPLLSDVVRQLIFEWYPDKWSVFVIDRGSIFEIVYFFFSKFDKLAESFGINKPEHDPERSKLAQVLHQICSCRYFWTHPWDMTLRDCCGLLLAVKDFIGMIPPKLKPEESGSMMKELGVIISSIRMPHAHAFSMSVDDTALIYVVDASRYLTSVSTSLLMKCPGLAFCVQLRRYISNIDARQSSVVEARDVARFLVSLVSDRNPLSEFHSDFDYVRFDSAAIQTVWDHLALRPQDGNSFFIFLLALGSLSRMLSLVLAICCHQAHTDVAALLAVEAIQAEAKDFCSTINEWQAVLLERANMLNINALVAAFCKGHRDVLDQNDYLQFARDDYQRLRLLVQGQIMGSDPVPTFALKLQESHRKRERVILNLVARVPPASAISAESAVDWFVKQDAGNKIDMSYFDSLSFALKFDVYRAARSDDAVVSRHAKEKIAE
jgi:hypothetical protein